MRSSEGAESELWAAARAADGSAFASLFDRHYDRVFRHVVGLVDGQADADEVTASTFLELWRRRDSVRVVDGSILPWLLVTAGYLAKNQGRRTRRYRALLHELADGGAAPDLFAFAESRAEEQHDDLARAIEQLDPLDAQLIGLTTTDGMTIADAARVLSVTPGAARVRLHRARKRLRAVLESTPAESATLGRSTDA